MCVWSKQRDGKTSGANKLKDGEAAGRVYRKNWKERGESSLRPKDAPRLLVKDEKKN